MVKIVLKGSSLLASGTCTDDHEIGVCRRLGQLRRQNLQCSSISSLPLGSKAAGLVLRQL